MAIKTLDELKDALGRVKRYPDAQDFADLLESFFHLTESSPPASLGGIKRKLIEIGDWDMDATTSVQIVHGLTYDKIVGCQVLIRNDANNSKLPIPYTNPTGSTLEAIIEVKSTTIDLARSNGGFFDSTDWDSTSYNRGWIIVEYTD